MKRPKLSRASLVMLGVLIFGVVLLFASYETKKFHDAEENAYQESVKEIEEENARRTTFPGAIRSINRMIDAGKFSEAEALLAALEKDAPKERLAAIYHRRAELHYASCESHLRSFLFFLRTKDETQSGLERDMATKECETSEKYLESALNTGVKPVDFFGSYGAGNESVRKALTAVSAEAQIDALRQAIRAYVAALDADKNDYETKVNLELLLDLNEKAKQAASGQGEKKSLSPEEFSLQPSGKGVGAGTTGKSQL